MIKYPGATIAFWSAVYTLVAIPVAYDKFANGKTGYGLLVTIVPIGCILIWLGIRPAKWLLAAYLGIAALRAGAALFTDGPSLSAALGTALAAYTAFRFATWNGGSSADTPVA